MTNLQQNYQQVLRQIKEAESSAKRPAGSVHLVAVSKTFPSTDIRALYQQGQRDFGENYIQEWYAKTEELLDCPDLVWHVIGRVQSNKTKYVAERAHWLHSLDRFKTAQRLNDKRPHNMLPLQVCIEVNIANEVNKHGVAANEVIDLAIKVNKLPKLQMRGLMCVAEANAERKELQRQFQQMQSLLKDLQSAGIAADVLSMGMSADMDLAIAAGATHVRIGSAIFGNRKKQNNCQDNPNIHNQEKLS